MLFKMTNVSMYNIDQLSTAQAQLVCLYAGTAVNYCTSLTEPHPRSRCRGGALRNYTASANEISLQGSVLKNWGCAWPNLSMACARLKTLHIHVHCMTVSNIQDPPL